MSCGKIDSSRMLLLIIITYSLRVKNKEHANGGWGNVLALSFWLRQFQICSDTFLEYTSHSTSVSTNKESTIKYTFTVRMS